MNLRTLATTGALSAGILFTGCSNEGDQSRALQSHESYCETYGDTLSDPSCSSLEDERQRLIDANAEIDYPGVVIEEGQTVEIAAPCSDKLWSIQRTGEAIVWTLTSQDANETLMTDGKNGVSVSAESADAFAKEGFVPVTFTFPVVGNIFLESLSQPFDNLNTQECALNYGADLLVAREVQNTGDIEVFATPLSANLTQLTAEG